MTQPAYSNEVAVHFVLRSCAIRRTRCQSCADKVEQQKHDRSRTPIFTTPIPLVAHIALYENLFLSINFFFCFIDSLSQNTRALKWLMPTLQQIHNKENFSITFFLLGAIC